ncbi:MAG: hypothetical protein JWN28_393 [Candidatus Saccharibacteria bacterium]|nr:hypothetical protein [Candidatus Saccharibacteria bacterium]
MAIKEFTSEGVPTDGTQLTLANEGAASGTAIAIVKGTGASITGTAVPAEVIMGTKSVKIDVASGSYGYLSWPESSLTAAGFRAYLRLEDTATSYSIIGMGNGSGTLAKVILLANGHLYAQDLTGSVTYITPAALTFPGIYAIDLVAQVDTANTNGRIMFAVYDADGDLTGGMNAPFDSTTANTGSAAITSLNVGKFEPTQVDATMIIDNIKRTDTFTLIGPQASSAAYTAVISPTGQLGLNAGQLRTFSAANSTGSPTVYEWTQTAGPAIALSNDDSVTTSYLVPATKANASVTVQLKVGNNSSLSAPVSVTDTIDKHAIWYMKSGTLTPGTFRRQTLGATTVTATNVTTDSVTLNWTGVTGASSYLTGRNGSDSNGNGPYETTDSSSSRSRTFINLLPDTTYTLYCTPKPGGVKKSITITTAALPQTQSWDWSDSNLPWEYSSTSVFTSNWPAGTTIVDLQTGSGSFYDRLRATVIAANKRVVVRLPAGVHSFSSFVVAGTTGGPTYAFGFWHPNLQGLLGQGPDQTFVQMNANSVSQAQLDKMKTMEAGPEGGTINHMGFMRLDGTSASPVLLAGLTFRADDQNILTDGTASTKSYGAFYPDVAPFQGIVLFGGTPGIVQYVRFQAAAHAKLGLPPFEHSNFNTQLSTSIVISHCEMDGRLSPVFDSTRPRRCGRLMANNEISHKVIDSWLHDALYTRYAANDQNRDTFGTYELTRSKLDHFNPSCAGWESCAATINITDCIMEINNPNPSSATGNVFHLSLTPVGANRPNPQGGRLNVTRGVFTSPKYPSVDGYLTIRAIASMHWVTDGYSNTMRIYGSNGQRKTPYVVGAWPASASTLASAGVDPDTHFLVRTT